MLPKMRKVGLIFLFATLRFSFTSTLSNDLSSHTGLKQHFIRLILTQNRINLIMIWMLTPSRITWTIGTIGWQCFSYYKGRNIEKLKVKILPSKIKSLYSHEPFQICVQFLKLILKISQNLCPSGKGQASKSDHFHKRMKHHYAPFAEN